MKLLFDQNLSPRLVVRRTNLYPDSTRVKIVRLNQADDRIVWDYAQAHNYIIVTKDVIFSELSLLLGFLSRVVWMPRGNFLT